MPVDRKQTGNAFEFVALAGQRARQLLRGCTPRIEVEGTERLVKLAALEVATGVVTKVEETAASETEPTD